MGSLKTLMSDVNMNDIHTAHRAASTYLGSGLSRLASRDAAHDISLATRRLGMSSVCIACRSPQLTSTESLPAHPSPPMEEIL